MISSLNNQDNEMRLPMKMNIHFIRIIIKMSFIMLVFISLLRSLEACEHVSKPEIIQLQMKGAQEFAERIDQECEGFDPEQVGMIFDHHGVLSRYSKPYSYSQLPRGDMPDYVRYRKSRGNKVTVASGSDEVFEELKHFNLTEILEIEGQVEKGKLQVGQRECEYYKLGKVASFRYLTPTLKGFSQIYSQKAFSPIAVYGVDCSFSLLIYIEDNPDHIEIFKEDVVHAPYYLSGKLQKIIIVKFPMIDGGDSPEDRIDYPFLPREFRTQLPQSDGGSEFIRQVELERSSKPFILGKPPEKFFLDSNKSTKQSGSPLI